MLKKYMWFSLPVLLLMYQIFILGHYGFGSNDYGYLFGMGWRILNGQEIYTDFIYARPPLSPYLTAFWLYVLPEDGQFYYARVVNYLYGFTTATLLFLVLKRHFVNFFKDAPKGLILALIIMFNVNYIVHFWHTTDGLLMASIALFIIVTKAKPSLNRIIIASLFVFLSMMAKQSFYPLPFALGLFLWINYGYKTALKFTVSMAIVFGTMILGAYLFAHEQLFAYLDFKHYESQFGPFLEAAIVYYVLGWGKLFPATAAIILIVFGKYLWKYIKRKQYAKAYARFMLFYARFFLILYALLLLQFVQVKLAEGESIIIFHTPLLGGMLVAVVWFIIELQQRRLNKNQIRVMMVWLLTISLAWMSSLSWGYKSPALYSGTIIFFFIYLNWHYTRKHLDKIYLYGLLGAYAVAVATLQFHSFTVESVHLGQYSKKLNGIYERNVNELKTFQYVDVEVKKCKAKGQIYAVLPSNPYIHWIHNDYPTLSLDWVSNVEMLNKKDRLKKEISEIDCIVLDPYYEFWENEKFGFNPHEILGVDYNATKAIEEIENNAR